jgi:hypothetical protein
MAGLNTMQSLGEIEEEDFDKGIYNGESFDTGGAMHGSAPLSGLALNKLAVHSTVIIKVSSGFCDAHCLSLY